MFPTETLVVKGKLALWYKYSFKIRHHLVALETTATSLNNTKYNKIIKWLYGLTYFSISRQNKVLNN
jgi:hypothetical protein